MLLSGLLPPTSFSFWPFLFVNAAPSLYLSQLTITTTLCLWFLCGGSSQWVFWTFQSPSPNPLPPSFQSPAGLYFRQGIVQNVLGNMLSVSSNPYNAIWHANRDALSQSDMLLLFSVIHSSYFDQKILLEHLRETPRLKWNQESWYGMGPAPDQSGGLDHSS